MNTFKFYMSQLLPSRFELYSKSWWEIGIILFRIGKDNAESGYELWLNKTISSNTYDTYREQSIAKCKRVCEQKWSTFSTSKCLINFAQIVRYVYEDGGSVYNPDHGLHTTDVNIRKFVYGVIVPKISIRRMRNVKALINLCSALYHMSSGEDRYVLDLVSKRIKDSRLRKAFYTAWDYKKFTRAYGLNDIINWYNEDESNRNELKYDVIKYIKRYTNGDTLWIEQTTRYFKNK